MDDVELQKLVKMTSLTYFGKPFRHRAYLNGRLKTTGGRYHLESHNIDINKKMADAIPQEQLIGIIKHELVHYHLHLAGYSGKHNTQAFKSLLKEVGGSRYAPMLKKTTYKYEYQCGSCGQTYFRKRRINTSRYVCGKCRGKLKLVRSR